MTRSGIWTTIGRNQLRLRVRSSGSVHTLEDVLQLWLLLEQGAQRIKDLGFAV